ncbi:hypothetical protein M951_chr3184 (nucleomorph) [Lotharella oceanica]|uniref:Uncharacterized protein n=1 Tax=Lotharella oceanica TaxID=641309 RepID=A0A060DGV3_9EUKA|nr:hypothetical protein M951_chr121 [Lotharella oceanica]AIB09689.1 hypothetical protein M951_chr1210 [Lotharella oceanica]AIB09724.1 hypothetical protein M951_chr221 [Lotharella oceanica]AIB09892.1 hypothetical protein M951_chr2200 [Lotharella oceanica]AIB09927.1 hypothetical protein M951_chr321 [Lotharella oceanica]
MHVKNCNYMPHEKTKKNSLLPGHGHLVRDWYITNTRRNMQTYDAPFHTTRDQLNLRKIVSTTASSGLSTSATNSCARS